VENGDIGHEPEEEMGVGHGPEKENGDGVSARYTRCNRLIGSSSWSPWLRGKA
jgi:hypothetical protein